MPDIKFREHKDAVIDALEAAGLTVGDAEAPDSDPPYVVVYSIPGGSRSGNLDDPYEDAELVFQVTCVGVSSNQALFLVDRAETVLDGVTVAGRSIHPMPDSNPGVTRQDTVTPPLFLATPRFRLKTTPA